MNMAEMIRLVLISGWLPVVTIKVRGEKETITTNRREIRLSLLSDQHVVSRAMSVLTRRLDLSRVRDLRSDT
jgi:hypothetical protein